MIISKFTLFAFAVLVIISTLVAKFQSIVQVDDTLYPQSYQEPPADDELRPDDRFRHIIWFLQISDLHLSIFEDLQRGPDLKRFCAETVPAVMPSVVLATGDLIDAKMPDHLGSKQYIEEWRMYRQALYETGVTRNTVWLDIRGNHDNFNVLSVDEENNFFRKYSVQGEKHRRSYSYELQKDTDKYTFIGIDACMEPGPKRPFNFLGVLQKEEYNLIQKLSNESVGSNMTIWFGHYPTSTIISPSPGVRELIGSSGPYLCGHLHTLGGLVPEMYTLQSNGFLELELADWKANRKYRIAAVDYGLFTFADYYLGHWPVVLVTNPKSALLAMPLVEPVHRMLSSSHVRVLVFSPESIVEVKLKIDNGPWEKMKHVKGPLYVHPWQSYQYSEGIHKMKVYARDANGSENLLDHHFSLDGTRPTFPLGARITLMGHISLICLDSMMKYFNPIVCGTIVFSGVTHALSGQILFAFVLLITVLPLTLLRVLFSLKKGQKIITRSESNCFARLTFKLFLMSSIGNIFWPIMLGALYVALGPWFIGYIIDGHIGICFVWGIFIGGHFLPGGLTYFAGMLYFMTFYIPLIFFISHFLYCHCRRVMEGDTPVCGFFCFLCRHFVMLLFIAWEMLCAMVIFFSYGTIAFFLSFTHFWSIMMALVLWRIAVTYPEEKIVKLGIWEKRRACGTPLLPDRRVSRQLSEPSHDNPQGIHPS